LVKGGIMDYKIISNEAEEIEIEETSTNVRKFKLRELEEEIKNLQDDIDVSNQILQKLLDKRKTILALIK